MDLHTFGDSLAAIELVKILIKKNEPKLNCKVGNLLSNFSKVLNELSKIDSKTAIYLGEYVMKEFSLKTKSLGDVEIGTFTNNILHLRYRIFLQKLDATKPYKNRKC